MATVSDADDVTTEAGDVEEERGAGSTSPLPPVASNEHNDPGDPPAYPGNDDEGGGSGVGAGQEMVVMGTAAGTTRAEEPTVTFVARDETTSNWKNATSTYSFSLSTSVGTVYTTFANDAGYVEGTFTLQWRRKGASEEEEELFEKSSATLLETGMEGGREAVFIRDRNGTQPEKVPSSQSSSGQGSKVTPSTLNNTRATGSNSYSTSGSYGYGSYSYQNYSYKSETGFVGLVNQAMTCYLNSLLQTLFMTPEFRNALYEWRFTRGHGDDGVKSIPYQLQRLFVQLQTSEKRAVETTDVTKSFGWDSSEAWQQHDVQELCRVMFDALEKRFKKDSHREADLINHLYQGTLKDYVKCLECHCESAREDHFLDIPLVIKPFGFNTAYRSVEEAMQAFVEPETLTKDNQYMCENCQKKCDAHKGLKFKSFPYLLTLQLKRFDFDYTTMHRIKLNDRMTFPRILDLNGFVAEHDMPAVPEGVEERYRDFVVEVFDPKPPPYNYYGRHNNASSYSNTLNSSYSGDRCTAPNRTSSPVNSSRDDDEATNAQAVADNNNEESVVANSNNEEEVEEVEEEVELTVGQRLKRGPYVYELFSIMIHSGSAIGGHYYAYIKSFSDKRWYCFNDQSASKLNEEDIEGTFGGSDSRSRGYYSSMYASSANAYMLMYRRIDQDKNAKFLPKEDLPEHVRRQIEEDRLRQEEKRRMEEYDRSLCKFRLFARHPVSGELMERKIEVQETWTLQDTIIEAHKLLELKDVVSVRRCRLVRYDDYTECLDQSFDDSESGERFSHMVGGPRNYYSYELYLEVRGEDEAFRTYNRGGLNLKVLVVDVSTNQVASPVAMRAEQTWAVLELKQAISEKFGLPVETMNLAVETYQNDGRHLPVDSNLLKNESFFKKHTVFACSDAEDYERPFRESEMNKLIEVHVNSSLFYVTIPPPPQRRQGALEGSKVGTEATEDRNGDGEGEGEVVESSVAQPEDTPTSEVAVATNKESEGSETTPTEDPPVATETVDMTKDRPLQRMIEVRVDRRKTLQELKELLVPHVMQPVNNFKVYRLYSNQQEYEMTRLHDQLTTVPSETRLIVRLGRALLPGEVRVRLSLLRMDQPEFCKSLMESIVTKGMSVREFKEQLVREVYEQGIEYPLQLDRLRIRKKMWKTASTIYLDSQVFEKDIHTFPNFEMYVECLKGPEPMSSPDQMQVYLKRWRPSSFSVDAPHEVILDQNSPAHLRERLAEVSGIPAEDVMFAKAHNSFPCELSVLDLEDELEWNPAVSTISSMPLSIYDDGAILYYKDGREKLMELTAERKSEIQKQERLKPSSHSGTGTSYHRYHAKEKALKIYTGEDEEEEEETGKSGAGEGT